MSETTKIRTGEVETPQRRRRHIKPDAWQGAFAGLMGGIAGSAAKLLVEQLFPPRVDGQKAPPAVLAERAAGHALSEPRKQAATQAMHWSFGPVIGAVYGAAVEYQPELAARHGAAFGLGLNGLTHEGVLPMLGLNAPAKKQPGQERWSEIASHVAYGVVTETVRRLIRGR